MPTSRERRIFSTNSASGRQSESRSADRWDRGLSPDARFPKPQLPGLLKGRMLLHSRGIAASDRRIISIGPFPLPKLAGRLSTGCNDVGSLPEPIQFLDRHGHPCGAQRRAVGSERGRRWACRTTLPVHRRARWQLPPAGRGSRTNVCTRRKRTCGPQRKSGFDPGCVKTQKIERRRE
jgi:hypothetical protein